MEDDLAEGAVAESYRRRATATPNRKATNRLASGASRVIAATVARAPPGLRDSSMVEVKRSTAACRPPATSPIVRETSAAVSMARSAMPGWDVDCGISVLKCATSKPDGGGRHLWLSARALVLNSGSDDLWLSATGAVINGGCRPWMGNASQGLLFLPGWQVPP